MRVLGLSSVAFSPGAVPVCRDAWVAYSSAGSLARALFVKAGARTRASAEANAIDRIMTAPFLLYSAGRPLRAFMYHFLGHSRILEGAIRAARMIL
jgi:hypothetical protein